MKANSPERLYFGESDKHLLDAYSTKESGDDIEYARIDVLIEKASKFFAPYIQDNSGGYDRERVLKNFENYIKEEKCDTFDR